MKPHRIIPAEKLLKKKEVRLMIDVFTNDLKIIRLKCQSDVHSKEMKKLLNVASLFLKNGYDLNGGIQDGSDDLGGYHLATLVRRR